MESAAHQARAGGIVDQGPSLARRLLVRYEPTPLRVTLLYLVCAFGALFGSDVLLVQYVSGPLLDQLQTLKGGIEIVLTAGFIYVLSHSTRMPVEQLNVELKRQQGELRVLHRILRHNLRNNLNVIEGFITEISRHVESAELHSMCEITLDTTHDLIDYTEQVARIRRITEDNGTATTVDLSELIPELLDTHELITDEISVTTTLPDSAEVQANHLFDEALEELVTNAIRHNDSEQIELAITVAPEEGTSLGTRIEIRDNGPGIPEEVHQVFGDPDQNQLVHLDGLGLWFVYLTVMESGGKFAIESNPGRGTNVSIWLPRSFSLPGDGNGVTLKN